jgi:hypothetical protein
MDSLSEGASFILDRMEPDRRYEVQDLRALGGHTSNEGLREVMHELWVNRQVERVGDSGWRRHRSVPPHCRRSVSRQHEAVTLEDSFDHAALTDFFK